VDFCRVRTFNLDEYYPIEPDHPQSYHRFMWEHLFSGINVRRENVHLPRGTAPDPGEECRRYEAAIEDSGGIDLLLLGVGANGHIGFNEPGTRLDSTTHLVQLARETVAANARFFDRPEDVPRLAITMGIKTIMRSRRLLLLASGASKGAVLATALEGPVTPGVPASVVQLHPFLTVIADRAAASGLQTEGRQPVRLGGGGAAPPIGTRCAADAGRSAGLTRGRRGRADPGAWLQVHLPVLDGPHVDTDVWFGTPCLTKARLVGST